MGSNKKDDLITSAPPVAARAVEFCLKDDVAARSVEFKLTDDIVARSVEFGLSDELVARIKEIALLAKKKRAETYPDDRQEENNFAEKKPKEEEKPLEAYPDTVKTTDELVGRHDLYKEILNVLAEGEGKVYLSERLILRSVDEVWVKAVEECINSLDELIRNPTHFIAESEEVLPIEKTKRISGRSVAHLCRHTDYVTVNEKNEISPLKMLNVFREDSILTYENKFLNTLINRLYIFVNSRYKIAKDYGVDEKNERFEYENSFSHGEGKGKIKISVEYSERDFSEDVRNKLLGTGLWARVEKLNSIVTGYVNSPFAVQMGKNFVHPPILRTNAIIKNKYFRECLALWEFIESYDDAGYGITVEETAREISDEYVRLIYACAAEQYLIFRNNANLGEAEEVRKSNVIPSYYPEMVKSGDYSEKFTEYTGETAIREDELAEAIAVALKADEILSEIKEQESSLSENVASAEETQGKEETEREENPISGQTNVSFGSMKSDEVEKMSVALDENEVKENIGADKLASMEAETKMPVSIPVRRRTAADDLAQIVRPDNNYSRPTEFGIDDSSGFLKDDESEDKDNASDK